MEELDNIISYHDNFFKKQILPKVTYTDRLLTLNIHTDVIEWIRNNLDNTPGKITNEHLFALIVLGYADLSIPFDPIKLNENLKVNSQKVSGLLSGTNSSQCILSKISLTIPISVISPKNYINKIVKTFSIKHIIDGDINKLIENIEYFTEELCLKHKIILQENPNDMAFAIIFYYISLCITGKKISKSDFDIEGFNKQSFNKCYKTLLKIIEK